MALLSEWQYFIWLPAQRAKTFTPKGLFFGLLNRRSVGNYLPVTQLMHSQKLKQKGQQRHEDINPKRPRD
jgi:hypothetical protein